MRGLRHLKLAAAALLLLLAVPSARAEEPDRSAWLVGHTYTKGDSFSAGGLTVEVYIASDLPAESQGEMGVVRFLAVREGAVVDAYRVDATLLEGGGTRMDLRWLDQGAEEPGVRVVIAFHAGDVVGVSGLRPAVKLALEAADGWRAGSALLAKACAEEDPVQRRPLALGAYRALERVLNDHAGHLGVLRDLLVADQVLVPLEAGSDRGANLAFLWREHVAAVHSFGDDEDLFEALRTTIVCTLAEGCTGHAAMLLGNLAPEVDEGLDALRAVVDRLGQGQQEHFDTSAVVGRTGTLQLQMLRCAADVPEGVPFHRLTFLTETLDRPGESRPTWFSLTCERTGERTRWALHGWVGGSRRLLHLYGAEEPAEQAVLDEVVGLVRTAVRWEEPK